MTQDPLIAEISLETEGGKSTLLGTFETDDRKALKQWLKELLHERKHFGRHWHAAPDGTLVSDWHTDGSDRSRLSVVFKGYSRAAEGDGEQTDIIPATELGYQPVA